MARLTVDVLTSPEFRLAARIVDSRMKQHVMHARMKGSLVLVRVISFGLQELKREGCGGRGFGNPEGGMYSDKIGPRSLAEPEQN